MQPASGSEFYPSRDARTHLTRGFLLGHRHRTHANEQGFPLPNFPHTPLTSRNTSSNTRRKRSTDTVFLTGQDENGKSQQENQLVSCCHLTPIETTSHREPLASTSHFITLRVKVRQFSATARSASGACTASTSVFVPTCCSNNKAFSANKSRSTSVFKPLRFHSTNVASPSEDRSAGDSSTSRVPSRNRPLIKLPSVGSGKAKGSETDNSATASPLPLPSSSSSPPSPAIFDVGSANLAPETVSCTTTYRNQLDSVFDSFASSSLLFPSFDALDDLTRWGMDSMSFLSTSQDHASNIDQITHSNPNSIFSNPFSTPFGDDDLLENEIPFPSTRPRVVLEPMGVKKSKTLAADKARNPTAPGPGLASSTRSRYLKPFTPYNHSPPNRPAPISRSLSFSKSNNRPPPILPHPLPPLQSAGSPSPLNDDTLARTSSYLQKIAEPSQPSSTSVSQDKGKAVGLSSSTLNTSSSFNQDVNSQPPTSSDSESGGDSKTSLSQKLRGKLSPIFPPLSRKALNDHEHLGAEDCELSIMFPQTAHYEVWDMSDHGWVSVPALLCLMLKDPRRWAATPLATPDVSLIELKCDDIPLPVRFSSLCPGRTATSPSIPSSRPLSPSVACRPNTYLTTFLGGKSASDENSLPRNGGLKKRGMSMMDAMKKQEEEQKMGKDKISLEGKWTRTFGLPGVGGCDIKAKLGGSSPHKETPSAPTRGWYLKFWVPIPTRLFLKRETRIFRIHAQIWMMDEKEEKPDRFETELEEAVGGSSRENDVVPSLEANTEMTVSHLRKERDMDGWW